MNNFKIIFIESSVSLLRACSMYKVRCTKQLVYTHSYPDSEHEVILFGLYPVILQISVLFSHCEKFAKYNANFRIVMYRYINTRKMLSPLRINAELL